MAHTAAPLQCNECGIKYRSYEAHNCPVWRCLVCGSSGLGLAPDVRECSCVDNSGRFPKSKGHNFVISSKRGVIPPPEADVG